ncbi:hypothetical protein C1645_816035, partial [Glomus cerebriforme]
LQEERKNLIEKNKHVLNLENQKNKQLDEFKRKYDNLQEEIKRLNEKDNQSQQRILNLEKQKSEELEIISRNLEKALGKLELDKLDERNKSLNDDYYKDKDYIQTEESEESEESVPSKDKSNQTHNSHSENEHSSSTFIKDIRVVVGLDFGTTYSGFSYCHVIDPKGICTNDQWSGNLPSSVRPWLPNGLNYKTAITDYLRKIGELIKETLERRWPNIDLLEQVLFVLTVPAEWSSNSINIMRECVFNAGLIGRRDSKNLQFTTEPEAVAIYCMNTIGREHSLTIESTFMVVDCGGGTVDLTTRELLANNKLSEITVRTGEYCGSTFIDEEFIKFLRRILGNDAIEQFRNNHYGQLQYIVQEFCWRGKFPFTGNPSNYSPCELDIEKCAPALLQYVSEEVRNRLEDDDWIIEIRFNDIKQMFDPVVDRILSLMKDQLRNAQKTCSTIFLAGGFSESRYLQTRIRQEFRHIVPTIIVPIHPITAISRGAVLYGLSLKNKSVIATIATRVLKYTYGIQEIKYWMEGDPIERKTRDGRIIKFHCLAKRGTQVETNQKVIKNFTPLSPIQKRVSFKIYYTSKSDAIYCDEPGMKLLGNLTIDLPSSSTLDRLLFAFTFGEAEINVTVKNKTTGQNYVTKLNFET